MSFVEDLSPFFNPAEFADTANLGGVVVAGIFDNAYQLGDVGDVGFAAAQPMFMVASNTLATSPVGQSLSVNGVNYIVAASEPDGTGVTRLLLERA